PGSPARSANSRTSMEPCSIASVIGSKNNATASRSMSRTPTSGALSEERTMHVRYSYLPQQFAEIDDLLLQIKALVQSGDFTLGAALTEFERRFAALIGTRYAVGVGSGTDALKLSLVACGVRPGDEVITAANTFIATAGAIHEI